MQRKKLPAFFINAFYESKFKDNLFVVKAGGNVVEDNAVLDTLMANIRDITHHGVKILLVYGGGHAMDVMAQERGIEVKKIEGRRITDDATLGVICHALAGDLALKVTQSMARNRLEGLSFSSVPVDWLKARLRSKTPVDYGHVGDVESVNPRGIQNLFRHTNFLATSCLCITPEGHICNINADTVATRLAIGTKAHKLLYLSDVDGVKIEGETAFLLTSEEIDDLIKKGVATDGMRVKLENCKEALEAGVKRIHLINGLRPDALKKEIYEPVGPGTMLIATEERARYLNEIEAQKILEAQQ